MTSPSAPTASQAAPPGPGKHAQDRPGGNSELPELDSRRYARSPSLRDRRDEFVDRLVGSDPGATQFRLALMAVLSIGVAVAAEYGFVRWTHALQLDTHGAALPPAQAAVVAGQHHAVLVIAMLLGAMVAMASSFVVNDSTPRGQLATSLMVPIPLLGAMALGLAIGGHRIAVLAYLVVALVVGTYVRRYGPRGFGAGLVIFIGAFLGYFLHTAIPIGQIGWVAAEFGIGSLASLLVRFTLFRPHNGRTLVRMQRSWVARSRTLAHLAWLMTEADLTPARLERLNGKLHRQLIRMNESTLMIDSQLVSPGATTGSATAMHQALFDSELALANVARFTSALAARELPDELRAMMRATLAAIDDNDLDAALVAGQELQRFGEVRPVCETPDTDAGVAVLAHRLAGSVHTLATAERDWLALGQRAIEPGADDPFVPAVALFAGWLPGSIPVSAVASNTPGRGGRLDRTALPAEVRASIQIGVAGIIAIVFGDLVNGHRLYWALLATFLAFMATSNSGEQIRKALFRIGGTGVGIVVGDVFVHVVGGDVRIAFAVIAIALFFGLYLIRINYMFMVIGVTVTMSQLYVQLDEFSVHLLLLRLAETGIGVGAVVVTVLLVFPLRPQRVLTTGALLHFQAMRTVAAHSLAAMTGQPAADGATEPTRADVRAMDASFQALQTTALPLRRGTFGSNSTQLATLLSVVTASRFYLRNLAAGVDAWPARARGPELRVAAEQLESSLAAIERRIADGGAGCYVRSAALFDDVDCRLRADLDTDAHLVLRDLTLFDGALAQLAVALGMTVTDHDTATLAAG